MSDFSYNEWHLIWKAVEHRASNYWQIVEDLRIRKGKKGEADYETWLHFVKLAQEQSELLNKVEAMANDAFPIVENDPFPPKSIETIIGEDKYEPWPNPANIDLDDLKL